LEDRLLLNTFSAGIPEFSAVQESVTSVFVFGCCVCHRDRFLVTVRLHLQLRIVLLPAGWKKRCISKFANAVYLIEKKG